jgi:hypothetical protein
MAIQIKVMVDEYLNSNSLKICVDEGKYESDNLE